MLSCTMLCCTVLCCVVLCYVVLCCVVSCLSREPDRRVLVLVTVSLQRLHQGFLSVFPDKEAGHLEGGQDLLKPQCTDPCPLRRRLDPEP